MSQRCVCAIDCGTSAVRASIAEIVGDDFHVLDNLERPVSLTAAFHGRSLDNEAMDAVVQSVRDILATAKGYGVTEVRAVATSALREAVNADALIERVSQAAQLEMEVIDGAEESRLYFEALRRCWHQQGINETGSVIMMDVGSGATVTSLINDGKLVHSVDEHFGTIRVFDQFRQLVDNTGFIATIDRFTHGAVRMILGRLPENQRSSLVVTGSEVRQLLNLIDPESSGVLRILTAAALEQWWATNSVLTRRTRARNAGCDPDSVSRLTLVASLMRHLLAETGQSSITVPQMHLRDGILADTLPGSLGPRHLDRDQVMGMAQALADRYNTDRDYAENTARLATQIFDQLRDLHHLGERERTLLEVAAWVHDIGAFINVRNRHKHSMYLIQAIDLPGLDEGEIDILAHVVRYHRRAAPKPNHLDFQSLPRGTRVRVVMLAAILRLAYGLDVERTQRIKSVKCTISDGKLILILDRRQIELERWSIEGKMQMFTDVFGLEVALLPRQEG